MLSLAYEKRTCVCVGVFGWWSSKHLLISVWLFRGCLRASGEESLAGALLYVQEKERISLQILKLYTAICHIQIVFLTASPVGRRRSSSAVQLQWEQTHPQKSINLHWQPLKNWRGNFPQFINELTEMWRSSCRWCNDEAITHRKFWEPNSEGVFIQSNNTDARARKYSSSTAVDLNPNIWETSICV